MICITTWMHDVCLLQMCVMIPTHTHSLPSEHSEKHWSTSWFNCRQHYLPVYTHSLMPPTKWYIQPISTRCGKYSHLVGCESEFAAGDDEGQGWGGERLCPRPGGIWCVFLELNTNTYLEREGDGGISIIFQEKKILLFTHIFKEKF